MTATLSPYTSWVWREVFSEGNLKLGKTVLTFSLPPHKTCPGESGPCKLCYIDRKQSYFNLQVVRDWFSHCYDLSLRPDFHLIVCHVLNKLRKRVERGFRTELLCRLHVSGDFYSRAYALKWYYVIKRSPHVRFWFYTRSWRIPEIEPVLRKLALLDNCQAWYSVDHDTGRPQRVPAGVRLAYLMTEDGDVPRYKPDLYFRDYALRKSVQKRVGNVLVCPPENGVSKGVSCERCRICLANPIDEPARRTRR